MYKVTMFIMAGLIAAGAQARMWTKTDGSVFEGDLFRIEESRVRIKIQKVDAVQEMDAGQLSAEDQAYLAEQQTARADRKQSRAAVPADRSAGWHTDLAAAKAEAEQYELPILLLYTAPSWCGYCRKLDQQLFNQQAFQAYADQNLVLFMADYSDRDAGKQWEEKNKALVEACPVNGFPHSYLLTSGAENLGSIQYYEPKWSIQDYLDKIEFRRMAL